MQILINLVYKIKFKKLLFYLMHNIIAALFSM
jgi:hypothetical protein